MEVEEMILNFEKEKKKIEAREWKKILDKIFEGEAEEKRTSDLTIIWSFLAKGKK
jgi:hypothetical protein